ncbi:hypothetical protein [uncultured Bacteroides sp.]|uniref:hypothetical protein n=1 Tax=uncultured Bacteroides sp. TaxID=162156 RepID=UPI00258EDBA7|nr:hypothetical protein [uncultured Bacteroides sp.]
MKIKLFKVLTSVLLLAIYSGCDNKDLDEVNANNYNNPSIPVDIKVKGVDWEEETAITRTTDEIKKTIIPVNDELEIVATVEPDYEATAKTRAKTTLTVGATYRVIAYEQGGAGNAAKYIKHADFNVGTTPNKPFTLPLGCTYDIVCYSNNETGALDTFDKETYEFSYATGKMPLYCKTTLTIPANASTTALDITFKHIESAVKVIVQGQTEELSIKQVTGVTIGDHYNKIKMNLSGRRNNPGTVPSTLSVPMNEITGGNSNRWESNTIHIISHDDIPSPTLFVRFPTIKLENSEGKEFTISDKELNPVKFEMAKKYKATLTVTTTRSYTITVSTREEDGNSLNNYANINLRNSGGTVTNNGSNNVTFDGKLGANATASYVYKQGIGENYLQHYLFSGWKKFNTASGTWDKIADASTNSIQLNPSNDENGAKYAAYFTRDMRKINYHYMAVGDYLQGGTNTEGETIINNTLQQEAYKEFNPLIWIGSKSGVLPYNKGIWHIVAGIKMRTGWKMLMEEKYTEDKAWGYGIDDRLFVPFDELPGGAEPRENKIRLYAAFYPDATLTSTRAPQNDAEWENYAVWKGANTRP